VLTERRLTSAEAADLAGLDLVTVWKMLKGRTVSVASLKKFADALHVDAVELISIGRLELAGLSQHAPPEGLRPVADAPPPPPLSLRGRIGDFGHITLVDSPPAWAEAPVDYLVGTDQLCTTFPRGDRLTFRPSATARKGQVAIVAVDGQEQLVKYAGKTREGALLVCPPNAPDLSHPTGLPNATIVGVLKRRVSEYD